LNITIPESTRTVVNEWMLPVVFHDPLHYS
jgi:hypothetical protein